MFPIIAQVTATIISITISLFSGIPPSDVVPSFLLGGGTPVLQGGHVASVTAGPSTTPIAFNDPDVGPIIIYSYTAPIDGVCATIAWNGKSEGYSNSGLIATYQVTKGESMIRGIAPPSAEEAKEAGFDPDKLFIYVECINPAVPDHAVFSNVYEADLKYNTPI